MTTRWRQHARSCGPAKYDWSTRWDTIVKTGNVAFANKQICIGACDSVVPDDITVAINVAAEQPNRWDLDCEYLKIGLSTPTEETEQSYTTFAEIVKTILRLVDEGHRIFVYCACGMNRSVSVAATAAARLDNTTVERKIIEIGEQRPEIWPEPFYVVVGQFLNREWE